MQTLTLFSLTLLLGLAQATPAAAQTPLAPEDLAQRAAAIRPALEDLRWQQVPWLDSLTAARDAARQEKRPIFVWAPDDDPFERC